MHALVAVKYHVWELTLPCCCIVVSQVNNQVLDSQLTFSRRNVIALVDRNALVGQRDGYGRDEECCRKSKS